MKGYMTSGGTVVLELTRRNLEGLLEKLSDPDSARTISIRGDDRTYIIKAVPNEEHYADREPGPMFTNGEFC